MLSTCLGQVFMQVDMVEDPGLVAPDEAAALNPGIGKMPGPVPAADQNSAFCGNQPSLILFQQPQGQ